MNKFPFVVFTALSVPLALLAQSTSGSSGTGTSEPGPSAAEASSFGNTSRSPSVTGSNDRAPRGTGVANGQQAGAAAGFHGSAVTADALFRALDTNGDGQLSKDEFAKVQSVMGAMGAASPGAAGASNEKRTGNPAPTAGDKPR